MAYHKKKHITKHNKNRPKIKQETQKETDPTQDYTNITKPDHHPHPPKQIWPVSPLARKEQERVKETSRVIGLVTAAAAAVAGGGQEAGRAGPGGTSNCREWSPGWRGRCACQHGGPPYPG